jgi:hypothetical protein
MMAELTDAAVIRLLLLPNREKKRKQKKNENNDNLVLKFTSVPPIGYL